MTMANPMTIFDVAGRAMSAQLVRMNSSASNLANAGSIAGDANAVYKPIKPVCRTELDRSTGMMSVFFFVVDAGLSFGVGQILKLANAG